jgi:hypothetical protein
VDPLAKACVPVYVEVFVKSSDYGPTFADNQRILLDVMYRFDKIWVTSYLTNVKVKDLISNHTADDGTTPLTASELSVKTYEIGQLLGQQFKYWFYAKNLT